MLPVLLPLESSTTNFQLNKPSRAIQTALLLLEALPNLFIPQTSLLYLPFILITGQLSMDVPVFLFELLRACS